MSKVWIITKRELSGFFDSLIAYVMIILFLGLSGSFTWLFGTNVFMIRKGEVHTPLPEACLPGITRGLVIDLAKENDIVMHERRISLSEFHSADEVFTTGTMGELTPVVEIDGRQIGNGEPGPMTARLTELFRAKTETEGEPLPF